jgi:hypothetical protein
MTNDAPGIRDMKVMRPYGRAEYSRSAEELTQLQRSPPGLLCSIAVILCTTALLGRIVHGAGARMARMSSR